MMPDSVKQWPQNEVNAYERRFDELFDMLIYENDPETKRSISDEMDAIQERIDWLNSL